MFVRQYNLVMLKSNWRLWVPSIGEMQHMARYILACDSSHRCIFFCRFLPFSFDHLIWYLVVETVDRLSLRLLCARTLMIWRCWANSSSSGGLWISRSYFVYLKEMHKWCAVTAHSHSGLFASGTRHTNTFTNPVATVQKSPFCCVLLRFWAFCSIR